MRFITYATHSERYYPALIESYKKFEADYTVLGFGEQWRDYLQKMNAIKFHLKNHCDPNEIVCVMDGFDSVLVRSPEEMEQQFRETGARLIFSKTEVVKLFYSLHWNNTSFLNAGLYIGFADAIVYLIETIMERHDGGYFNDQRLFGKWMMKNRNPEFRVDRGNQFFLNVASHKACLKILKAKRPFAVGGPAYEDLQPCIDYVGIPFQQSEYQHGQHTLYNRLMQGEFSEECQCVIPIALTVLSLMALIVVPFLAVYMTR